MEQFSNFSINKYQHRKIIGYLGLSIPFILVLGNLFYGCIDVQNSISHYYHTFMRDVFIGIIILIGLFFITYGGYPEDKIPFRIAGVSILFVAFFPTSIDVNTAGCCQEFSLTNRSFDISMWIHGLGALFFFATITYICLFLFTNNKRTKLKYKEAIAKEFWIKTCGFVMLIDIIVIALFLLFEKKVTIIIGDINLLFYLEVIALFAFSIAWLVKGKFINYFENKTLSQII